MVDINLDDLSVVTGGFNLHDGFGLRSLYRGAVKDITAVAGGWKLANQMWGDDKHSATWSEKVQAMRAVKSYLDQGDRLPAWAPNW